jgi:hypothetical protein
MKIVVFLDALYYIIEEQPENLNAIRQAIQDIKSRVSLVQDIEMRNYLEEFCTDSLLPKYLETHFEDFAGKLNELIVEFGNEGYFDDDDV